MSGSSEPTKVTRPSASTGTEAPGAFESAIARAEAAVRAAQAGGSQWQVWMVTNHELLDTPEKAIDFGEAVVRAAYGADQAEEECPFVAEDLGDEWRVRGTRQGSHAMPFFAVSSTVTLMKKTGAVVDYRLSAPPAPGSTKAPD